MRSLTDSQWSRYFGLIERLAHLPAEQRQTMLLSLRAEADNDVLALVDLHFGLSPEPDRCRSGERIHNFILGEPIGCGGMGMVYRARQIFGGGIEREVALKLIHPALILNEPGAALARFQQELASLVKLEHKGIARLYDGGFYRAPDGREETPFLAMELVRGEPITDYVAGHGPKLAIADLLRLFVRVCEAVAYAHRRGVIHRDLKPANILVDAGGEPRIIDFGLAQAYCASLAHNRTEFLSGTPAYMSPEQRSRGWGPLTPASDVYALGVILYELLTGRRPCLNSAPARLESGAELEQVIGKALAQDPANRYPSAAALRKAMARCLKAVEASRRRALQHRQSLINKVQEFWIDGVLNNSLHGVALLELGLALRPDAVEHPWDLIVQTPDRGPRPLPPGMSIGEVFRELGESMLILGAPGAGKTTLLLALARELLERAQRDESQPVPVLFHLAAWAERRSTLDEWIVEELDKRYDVSPGASRACLADARIRVLLDGLDEVAPAHRVHCAEAINAFHKHHGAIPLVVCSRVADYDALAVRLRLAGAVVIEELSRRQVDDYLERVGPPLAGARAALRHDERLWELLRTPLLLDIAALAYQERPPPVLQAAGTLEERRAQLFAVYTEAMFKRRSKITRYTPEQSMHWLGWLAAALLRHHQSVFYLEWMQPDWLPNPRQRWMVSVGSVTLCGLFFSLIVGLFGSLETSLAFSLPVALVFGLIGGLVFGLAGYGDEIRPITRLRWSWATLRRGLFGKLSAAAGVGLLLSAGMALVFDGRIGVAVGVAATLAFCYFGGLDFELIKTDTRHRTLPNEGMWRSLRHAVLGGATGALSGALAGGLVGGPLGGLLGGLVLGLVIALMVGGFTCLQHLILRLFLWRNGCAPWNTVRFLEYAVERIFLHRVGGGYIFVHRSLLEYFAKQYSATSKRPS